MMAVAAFAGPASADLTVAASNDPDTGFPTSVTDSLGQAALICLGPAPECGLGAPTASEIRAPDGEGFYWSGTVSVPLAEGDVDVAWDVEAATGPDGVQTTFQRVQIGSRVGTATLPDGEYTVTSPFGTFTATKDPARPNNWRRIESSSAGTGPVDHFLVSATAPSGYYGDADAGPSPVVGGATAGTVTVQAPGDPLTAEIGSSADWTITGRMEGTPVLPPPPPADGDGDGVPNNVDRCPSAPGPAGNNGCPLPPPPPTNTGGPGSTAGGTSPTTIIQVIHPDVQVKGVTASSPLAVSNLSLARRISIARLRVQGLRASMQVQEGTNVVRIAIYKARNGRRTGRALFTATRTPTRSGLFRVTLRSGKLSKLHRGSYVMEVRAGRSAATLGSVRRASFTVTR
jgi:hypothetical protein